MLRIPLVTLKSLMSRRWVECFILFVLLSYPIMGSKVFPFGGGGRYLSVLAGPLVLLLLFFDSENDFRQMVQVAWKWAIPFVPFALTWEFIQLWHNLTPIDSTPLTRVFWGAVIYTGARRLGLTRKQLAYAAGLGACAYFFIAIDEFFVQGRGRVWGGVYENRFGQFSVWLAGLCSLHFMSRKQEKLNFTLTPLLPLASVLALIAAILSGSRGAIAALPTLLIVTLLADKQNQKQAMVATAILFIAMSFTLLFPAVNERFFLAYRELKQYFDETVFTETSIGIRLEMWRIAFGILSEHPFLGIGFTSFSALQMNPMNHVTVPDVLRSLPDFHSDWGKIIGLGGALLLVSLGSTIILLFRKSGSDVYRLWGLFSALIFSFAELFFCNKLSFSFLVSTWALYSAAADNEDKIIKK